MILPPRRSGESCNNHWSVFRAISARALFRALLLGRHQLLASVVREQCFGTAIFLGSDVLAWRIFRRDRLWLRLRVFPFVRVFRRVSRRSPRVRVYGFVEKRELALGFTPWRRFC